MNKQANSNEDLLWQYLNPERIEKAPDGFTSEVMTHILAEPVPSQSLISFWRAKRVPLISIGIALLLTLAAFLLPGTGEGAVALPFVNFLKNFRFTLPEVNLTYLINLKLPAISLYVLGGILTLAFFDRALSVFFRREKS
jgi:hypothetical protein